jgi:hypothetical protein
MPNDHANESLRSGTVHPAGTPNHVLCSTCEREVPVSEAAVAEAVDYIVYFCGLECYDRWRHQGDS